MNGTNIRTTPLENHSNLVAKSSLFVDPAWSNPQLVFWFDNPFPGDLFVSVKSDLNWHTIARVPLTGQKPGSWQMTSVDLNQLKGKSVLLSISATLRIPKNALQANTSTGLISLAYPKYPADPQFYRYTMRLLGKENDLIVAFSAGVCYKIKPGDHPCHATRSLSTPSRDGAPV